MGSSHSRRQPETPPTSNPQPKDGKKSKHESEEDDEGKEKGDHEDFGDEQDEHGLEGDEMDHESNDRHQSLSRNRPKGTAMAMPDEFPHEFLSRNRPKDTAMVIPDEFPHEFLSRNRPKDTAMVIPDEFFGGGAEVVDPSLPWVKENTIIALTKLDEGGRAIGFLKVENEAGELDIPHTGGRQAQWRVHVVDPVEKLITLRSLFNGKFLRVHLTEGTKFFGFHLGHDSYDVNANGHEKDTEEITFKVIKNETGEFGDKVAFQLLCQAHGQDKYVSFGTPPPGWIPTFHKSHKKVMPDAGSDESYWVVKHHSKM